MYGLLDGVRRLGQHNHEYTPYFYLLFKTMSCQYGVKIKNKKAVLTAAAMLGITYYYYIDARRIQQQSTHIIFYYKIADKLTNDRAYYACAAFMPDD